MRRSLRARAAVATALGPRAPRRSRSCRGRRRPPGRGQERRRLGPVLGPVVHDVGEHLPERAPRRRSSASQCVGDACRARRRGRPTRAAQRPASASARGQRLALGRGRESPLVAPSPCRQRWWRAQVVDEDRAEAAVADDAGRAPDGVARQPVDARDSTRRVAQRSKSNRKPDVARSHRSRAVSRGSRPRAAAPAARWGSPRRGSPAASSAATLDAAVPRPPEMIAPAWPIRLPSGAVRPAMNATFGTSAQVLGGPRRRLLLGRAADLADQHERLGLRVVGEQLERRRGTCVPMTGSPPMPTHVDWPMPASVIAWTAS